ncbi:peroxisome biogenesis factor 10 [Venturia canescens]|uniref:peroxisome biogenesis factor 10 n=1 Tax=Venturia canescens TaxID=32260 RepID=UPI001C9BFE89|nr:peroxisome biogenesis factor 10 [Venturia canescens]
MGSAQSRNKSNPLTIASQAEILRARQRDDEFINHLQDKLSDLLHRFGGYRSILPFLQSNVPFKLIYFIVTSGFGNQTLGEEYTGIVQANLGTRNVPSMSARILSALLECFGEQGLIRILERLRVSINNPDSQLRPEAILFFNKFISKLKAGIPVFVLLHKGLFYIYGRYYSLGKRIAGVDYAKVQGKSSSDGVSWGLRLLGAATLAQCLLQLWQNSRTIEKSETEVDLPESKIENKCNLCLDASPTTTTPCGHLFCWECLGDWLRTRAQCPLCREPVKSSRMVYLMNL